MAVEDRVLRPLVRPLLGGGRGVRLCGTTAAGVTEWYGIEDVWLLAGARGEAGGRDLGAMTSVARPAGFGFSEFPVRPSMTTVTSVFDERPDV